MPENSLNLTISTKKQLQHFLYKIYCCQNFRQQAVGLISNIWHDLLSRDSYKIIQVSRCIFSNISEKFVTFLSSHIIKTQKKQGRAVFMLLKLLRLQTHLGAENLCVAKKKPKGFMVAKISDPIFIYTISHNVKIYNY